MFCDKNNGVQIMVGCCSLFVCLFVIKYEPVVCMPKFVQIMHANNLNVSAIEYETALLIKLNSQSF